MKKFITLLSVFTICYNSFAQLQIDSLGRVGVGGQIMSNRNFTVNGNGIEYSAIFRGGKNQVMINNTGEGSSGLRKGVSLVTKTDSLDSYGLYIRPNGNGTGMSLGVSSLGGVSTKLSSGIMGGLWSDTGGCGSGVIGSSSASAYLLQGPYRGIYAGFFQGDVRVTGSLYANVLTPTLTNNISVGTDNMSVHVVSRDADLTDESVSDKFKQVNLLKYIDNTDMTKTEEDTSESYESELYRQLISKIDNGEELNDDEIEQLNIETQTMEEAMSKVDAPQTKMASIRYGLAADQLKDVYPELVYEDPNGNISINYIEMVPLLVQSINELKADIEDLKEDNARLRSELTGKDGAIKSRNEATDLEFSDIDILSLSQNDPNPFSERTTINLTVPQEVTTAAVFFYDMNGKQIDKRIITERGHSQLSVTSAGFSEGLYLYSLIADGKVIATRKMILTK